MADNPYVQWFSPDVGRSSDKLADALRGMIMAGELPAGHVFPNELQFCALLGVGRSTLREAYRSLETTGFITRSKRGTRVNSAERINAALSFRSAMDAADYRDTMEFRLIFESEIAGLAAARATEAELAQMQACLEKMVGYVGNAGAFALADTEFHCIVAAATKNGLIAELISMYRDSYNKTIYSALVERGEEAYKSALAVHERLLALLRTGDSESARSCVREQLRNTYTGVLPRDRKGTAQS